MCLRKVLCSSCCCRCRQLHRRKRSTMENQVEEIAVNPCNHDGELAESYTKDSSNKENLKEPDENTEYILLKFTHNIKAALNESIGSLHGRKDFVLVGYQSQFVAGTDYFLKIFDPASGNYYHLRIYESLQGDLTLLRMSQPKTETDAILYF